MGILLDLLVILFFAVVILIGSKKGFVKSISGLIRSLGAFIIAGLLSRPIASLIFDSFFKSSLTEKIHEGLLNAGNAAASVKATALLDRLPGFMSKFVEAEQLEKQLEGAVNGAASSATKAVVSLLTPVFITFIQFISFFALFIIATILMMAFSKALEGVFRAPVLGSADFLLGGIFGALKAFIICLIIGLVLFIIAPQPGENSLFSAEIMKQSSLFSYFYSSRNLIISMFSSF